MSSCYEQMKPYVQWAAQQQLMDPNRFVVGVAISGVQATGEIINIQGHMDVANAKFSLDNSRFNVQLRGLGQRHIHTQHLGSSIGEAVPADTPVIIQVDANEREIRVRIGDKVARVVVDDFLLDCYNDSLLGTGEDIIYSMSLQRLERSGDGWSFVSAEQAAAFATPAAVGAAVALGADEPTAPAESEPVVEEPSVEAVAVAGAVVAAESEPPAEAEVVVEAEVYSEPVEPDDFQRLEGVGPATAAALNNIGVTTYAQLSMYDPVQLEADLTAAGEKLVPGSMLAVPAQAALAAAGRWNALKYIQTEVLKSGRPVLQDDLTKINGIGPTTVIWLDVLGITTFKQLRDADSQQVESDLKSAGLRLSMGSVSVWQEQAALAAENRWDDLAKLQGELAHLNEQFEVPEDETLS